jgi:hypothetical protein
MFKPYKACEKAEGKVNFCDLCSQYSAYLESDYVDCCRHCDECDLKTKCTDVYKIFSCYEKIKLKKDYCQDHCEYEFMCKLFKHVFEEEYVSEGIVKTNG